MSSSLTGAPLPAIAASPVQYSASRYQARIREDNRWWKEAVIYQIYVPSFKDTNKDGYGDIRGVIQNLDYLHDLGINTIWLSPVCDSPFYDMGYDMSDYRSIGPKSGTINDLETLIQMAHERDMKILMDIALNHTSTEHAWFKASREAQSDVGDQSKRNYYISRDGKVDPDGNEMSPNNWESVFEGSMWEYDEVAKKYYLHIFGNVQADFNWDCAALREEVFEVLRFWLDKGIDGFRLDAINLVSKVPGLPDAPILNPSRHEQKANDFFANGPNIHLYLQEMYEKVFTHYKCVVLGEMSCGITTQQAVDYLAPSNGKPEIDLIIQFNHVELDCIDGDKWLLRDWQLRELKDVTTKWQHTTTKIGAWNTVWMENHDQPRAISRFTYPTLVLRPYAAKLLALHMLTLRGTVLIYQGQELGLANPEDFTEDMMRDIETLIFWRKIDHVATDEASRKRLEAAKHAIKVKGRDAGRVLMPWDRTEHRGFTEPDVTS
ncbi:hypothetical protein AAFC00_004526 [Neodothiora populina]|uniref:Glycosyl hydrolase family 13 catalytic domain-containing protein n=1 Tax=Neodothiora populina TaxID=2781224 RepID=A0ABR3P3N4_9PEZI